MSTTDLPLEKSWASAPSDTRDSEGVSNEHDEHDRRRIGTWKSNLTNIHGHHDVGLDENIRHLRKFELGTQGSRLGGGYVIRRLP